MPFRILLEDGSALLAEDGTTALALEFDGLAAWPSSVGVAKADASLVRVQKADAASVRVVRDGVATIRVQRDR